MKTRPILSLVTILCLALVALPATAVDASSDAAPARVETWADWFQGGVPSLLARLSGSAPAAPADPADEPVPLLPAGDSGTDRAGEDPGAESSPQMDPDG